MHLVNCKSQIYSKLTFAIAKKSAVIQSKRRQYTYIEELYYRNKRAAVMVSWYLMGILSSGIFRGNDRGDFSRAFFTVECPEKIIWGGNVWGFVWGNVSGIFRGKCKLARVVLQMAMQHGKSVCAAVMNCATRINTQTYSARQTAFGQLYTVSSASSPKNVVAISINSD